MAAAAPTGRAAAMIPRPRPCSCRRRKPGPGRAAWSCRRRVYRCQVCGRHGRPALHDPGGPASAARPTRPRSAPTRRLAAILAKSGAQVQASSPPPPHDGSRTSPGQAALRHAHGHQSEYRRYHVAGRPWRHAGFDQEQSGAQGPDHSQDRPGGRRRGSGDQDPGGVGDPEFSTSPGHPRGAMLRAYDKKTGEQVGAVWMPAPQSGSPMTYNYDGKQYIMVAVSRRQLLGRLSRLQPAVRQLTR
jgi:hypothetical protein